MNNFPEERPSGPPYRDYTDEPLPPSAGPRPLPEPDTGTVFVREMEPGEWAASWQSGLGLTEMTGTRAEVLSWAWQQPARTRLEWSDTANDHVPLERQ